eukprot:jgi/Psemu1/45286/gm1.45286_g
MVLGGSEDEIIEDESSSRRWRILTLAGIWYGISLGDEERDRVIRAALPTHPEQRNAEVLSDRTTSPTNLSQYSSIFALFLIDCPAATTSYSVTPFKFDFDQQESLEKIEFKHTSSTINGVSKTVKFNNNNTDAYRCHKRFLNNINKKTTSMIVYQFVSMVTFHNHLRIHLSMMKTTSRV